MAINEAEPSSQGSFRRVEVMSLPDLRRVEPDLVDRLGADQAASQLFIIDPVRALELVGVFFSSKAVKEWESVVPGLAQRDQTRQFDRIRDMGPDPRLKVRVNAIVAPEGIDLAAEDRSTWRDLFDYTSGQAGP